MTGGVQVGDAPAPGGVRHLYVHAPFCARRCFYCDFAVDVRTSPDPREWADAIRAERHAVEAVGPWVIAPTLETLYVGGGTPSLLGPEAMRLLADAVGSPRLEDPTLEWTAEANPESLTDAVVRGWREAGVGRLSLGVQSFDEGALRWMGRLHGASGAREAVGRARTAGIENLSVDLIFGLPAEIPRSWGGDLEAAVALDVPHISLYGLTAEPGTPLHRRVTRGSIEMIGEERYRDEYLEAHERLVSEGYRHYEVSNFARPGFESRHNQAYWAGVPYFGFGNSAHSYLPPLRRGNLRDWHEYLARVRSGDLPWDEEDRPDAGGRRVEELWLGLRTDRGLDRDVLVTHEARRRVEEWERKGWAHPEPSRVRLTAEGWLVLDSLVLELDRILEGGRRGG
jgi:oxygen-independent coproporphyrinogen-3 oxidase